MISVVIPTYNQASFLGRAIESVWSQQMPETEIVVVDDCSTDETQDVLRHLPKTGEVNVVLQERNQGPAAARNRGIKHSKGEWIAFLDSDDYWLPGKLQTQIQALERDNQFDFAYCGSVAVDDEGKVVATSPAPAIENFMRELLWGNQIATPTMIVRRELLEKTGLFDESLQVGEDWDLWLRLASYARGHSIGETLVTVRHNPKGYPIEKYEPAVLRILQNIIRLLNEPSELLLTEAQKRQVLSWHFSVLAKSHLQEGNIRKALQYVFRSLTNSPHGLRYVLPTHTFKPQLKAI
jgi:glycosyltransferase involved in cell wall biosynthesis